MVGFGLSSGLDPPPFHFFYFPLFLLFSISIRRGGTG